MEDEFLIKNDVVGYYRIKPTTIKYVNFFQKEKFEWKTYPGNKTSAVKMAFLNSGVLKTLNMLDHVN